jgi:serine/threonine-protein kinase
VLDCIKTPIPNAHDVIEFSNSLHSRMIPRRWRLAEFSDGLVMEREWVPGRVLRSPDEDRNNPDSTYQRFLNLPIPTRLNVYDETRELFCEIEEQGVIIEDFSDGCVLYDFDADRASVCDLDHLHRGPSILTKERQFGSSRFMAPEEFRRGAVIDHRTNVFTMGATGFVLLNDNRRREADWPLSGETFRVLARATSERTEERQESIGQFCREWRRALGNAV